MNWLLIVVAAIIAGCAYYGYKKGIVKILFSICSLIVAIVLSSILTPHVNTYLRENTGIYGEIQEKCQGLLDRTQEGQVLPQSLEKTIENLSSKADHQEQDAQMVVADGIADMILSAISFMITLVVIRAALWIVVRMLDVITKLPIVHGLNQMAGLAFGLAEGLLIVWIFYVFLTCILQTSFGQNCMQMIAESKILAYLFDHNILTLIFRM